MNLYTISICQLTLMRFSTLLDIDELILKKTKRRTNICFSTLLDIDELIQRDV